MNKDNQLMQLQVMLKNPNLQSGLYLIDTDLNDEDIENYIKETRLCRYVKGELLPTTEGSTFELLIVGLSNECNNNDISTLLYQFLTADKRNKDTIIYYLLILIMKNLCKGEKSVVHLHGRIDISSLHPEDLCKLDSALNHHDETIFVISKQKNINTLRVDPIIKVKSLKEIFKYKTMDNRLNKVHISYKHDEAYENAIKAIIAGFEKNHIPYSIDKYDIQYRDSIDDYEKEIGVSDRIIMFVIPKYFESLDCMFEMTQIFKNDNIRERIYPVVDMGEIPRNGDGLIKIKNYWQQEKVRKSYLIQNESGGSSYLLKELQRIDDIIKTLDDLWFFICRNSTGNYKELIKNDAELLMEELKKTLPQFSAHIDTSFIPSGETKPEVFRKINQNGKNAIYIENNSGNITIN